jgi:peptidoglycan/LPS O-acetylase OafA/YrhL
MYNEEGQSRQRIIHLDGWRFVAASLVYGSHYLGDLEGIVGRVAREGHVGVGLFFIISGWVLGLQLAHINSFFSWKVFFKRRLVKLYTLYALFYLISLAYRPPSSLGEFLANVTLTKGLWQEYLFTGLAQGWSLTVELCFYLLLPWAAWFLKDSINRVARWWVGVGIWVVVSGAIAAVGLRDAGVESAGTSLYLLVHTLAGRGLEFWLGLGAAYGIFGSLGDRRRKNVIGSSANYIKIKNWEVWTYRIGSIVTALSFLMILQRGGGGEQWRSATDRVLGGWANSALIPFVLLFGLLFQLDSRATTKQQTKPKSKGVWISTWIGWLLPRLGRRSYAFYLLHLGLISVLLKKGILIALEREGAVGMNSLETALHFCLLWLAADFAHHWVERPLLKHLQGNVKKIDST